MNASYLFIILLVIIVFDFVVNQGLSYLNFRFQKDEIPDSLKGYYDENKYLKTKRYKKENYKISFIESALGFAIILMMLLFGGFALLDGWVRSMSEHQILQNLLYFGVIAFAMDLLSTPFSVYDTFVIEEKYGFNTTTPKIYIFDKVKGWLLMIIIGGGLLSLIVWIYEQAGSLFWIYVWIVLTGFSLFMGLFYSNLIVPLFNKQTPLETGPLRTKIEAFANKVNFKLKNIYVINGSKRSKKSNAYFTGFGPKKRIVLFDTLMNNHSDEEIVAILAHETGHYKNHHTLKMILMSFFETGVLLFLLSIVIENKIFAIALGVEQTSFYIGITVFGLLYSPVSFLLGIIQNSISRKFEYQADNFCKQKYDGDFLQKALKKLSVDNLSDLYPHPLFVYVNYSHPPLLSRLNALKREY